MARAREQGLSVVDSFNSLRTWATMQPLAFDAKESLVAYPPGSVYLMHLSGMAYKLISPEMHNSRLFNAFISFPMLLASMAVTWVIFTFIRRENHALAVATAMLYWLNPIVLLDSTIQGYNNPIVALVNLLALVCLYRKQYLWAVCLTVLAVLVKPQAILLIPMGYAADVLVGDQVCLAWCRGYWSVRVFSLSRFGALPLFVPERGPWPRGQGILSIIALLYETGTKCYLLRKCWSC